MMNSIIPSGERAEKWNRRYDPTHIKAITEAEKPTYDAHAVARFDELTEMEGAVKQTLNASGVSVSDVAQYLAYSRQVWKARQHYAGETLAKEVAVLIAKWAARGLTQAVLQAIRSEVFNVSAPIAPWQDTSKRGAASRRLPHEDNHLWPLTKDCTHV
jgi:hypothetical protein